MQTYAIAYPTENRAVTLRIELMQRIAETAHARREARKQPTNIIRAVAARAVEAWLIELAQEVFPELILSSFEDVVVAYDRSLN